MTVEVSVPPMHDIRFVRDNPQAFDDGLRVVADETDVVHGIRLVIAGLVPDIPLGEAPALFLIGMPGTRPGMTRPYSAAALAARSWARFRSTMRTDQIEAS